MLSYTISKCFSRHLNNFLPIFSMHTLRGDVHEDDECNHITNTEKRSESIKTTHPLPLIQQPSTPLANARIHSDLNCLSPQKLAKWLNLKLPLILIDCRYPYEYEGGHIEGAMNLHTEAMVHDSLLKDPPPTTSSSSRPPIVVFHCEYSSYRGPARYRYLRNQDRRANITRYPHLFYPHVYLLEGGYNQFYGLFPSLCTGGYVEMTDKKYKDQKRAHKRVKCNLMMDRFN